LKRSFLVLLLALGLVAGACSSDRGDDTSQASSGDSSSTTQPAPSADNSKFGDLASPCGDGDAKGATDVGVTDDKIQIAYGDDAGYPASPGVSHEASDAIKAFIGWCNDQGGINGRPIEGKYYDAKITDVVNAITGACNDKNFMLVGEAWALDSAQEQTRISCGLPAVPTYSVSADFAMAPLMRVAVPNPVDYVAAGFSANLKTLFPKEVAKVSMVYGNFSATQDTAEKVTAAYPKLGMTFVCPQVYNIAGESDWKPFAQKLKACGAEMVFFSGQAYPNGQNLIEAADQLDYHPIWLYDANNYLDSFAKWNTSGLADKAYFRSAFIPLEQADSAPAVKQYTDIVSKDGGDISQLGEQATSSFLLWATAVQACGSNVTRDCVFQEIDKVSDWTGGGLHAPTQPGTNMPPNCNLVLKLSGDKFEQVYPKDKGTFDCDDSYVVKITGRVVDQAKLGPDRISTKYQA
jgi:ABC-type branched-subunit amino acid transport system substrate-binding protein